MGVFGDLDQKNNSCYYLFYTVVIGKNGSIYKIDKLDFKLKKKKTKVLSI